jgi:predicted phage tail protein
MTRTIYLEGELGTRFIDSFEASVTTPQEALKLVEANFPEFRKYLIEADRNNVGFIVDIAGQDLDLEDLILPVREGDITITPAPIGSKSGLGKILAAVAIVAVIAVTGGFGAAAGGWATTTGTLAGMTTSGLLAASVAVNLALTGIQQLMAPDPSVDEQSPQAYLFNGSEKNIIEGDPVPVLYGELRVPGRPISFSVVSTGGVNNGSGVNNVVPGYGGAVMTYNPDTALV